jgi:peptidyl-dipeptidase Dcp
MMTNPLLQAWTTPYGMPPFAAVRAEHFEPAFEQALAEHRAEVTRIAQQGESPSFANTIATFDGSGAQLNRTSALFHNLTSSATSPELQAVERNMAPRLAAHYNTLYLDQALFARVDALHAQRASLALAPEQLRLLERIYLDFVLSGAKLAPAARERMAAVTEELANLTTSFSQNVLHDESEGGLWLTRDDELAGLPDFLRDAARGAASERGRPEAWLITLSRSLVVPFLTFSARRDLREQAFKAWKARGEHAGEHDNRPVAKRILALRQEQARLHGYKSYADYALVDRMAGTPAAVRELLQRVWEPAKRRAAAERVELQALAAGLGHAGAIEPWDWRYFAEKVRQQRFAVDDAQVKPYFPLDRVLAAAFDCAGRLFKLTFVERPDLQAYHADVRAFEVRREDQVIGLFLSDNFARPNKRSGAWMSAYRKQSRRPTGEPVIPIIVNNNNFAKAAGTEPTLLSLDDVRTLFHEFGHGLHGLLSNVSYETLSGTSVLRDFVELPSQLYEHWSEERAVLKEHARHYRTGEPIPDALLDKLEQARLFNQGYETIGYTACALLDLALHEQTDADGVDIVAFEQAELERLGMPAGCSLYHRLPHFQHLFSGDSYAAGYYVYMWAEVLDADGYDAFKEAGDPFDPAVAERLYRYIYSSGNSLEPRTAYRAFRGRDAKVEPLLEQRGLAEA